MQHILAIYEKYRLMPNLQEHQLRVAAVAQRICDSMTVPVDTAGVVEVCLLHDMGNIIKFDLTFFPQFLEPQGLAYWQQVQREYIEKYGPDEHVASRAICQEVGLGEKALSYLDTIGFTRARDIVDDPSLEKKICCYADQRVGPHGVVSITERREEGRKRYATHKYRIHALETFDTHFAALQNLERQIFAVSTLKPEDITDKSVAPIIASFKD